MYSKYSQSIQMIFELVFHESSISKIIATTQPTTQNKTKTNKKLGWCGIMIGKNPHHRTTTITTTPGPITFQAVSGNLVRRFSTKINARRPQFF
jgi:hypothetical protein